MFKVLKVCEEKVGDAKISITKSARQPQVSRDDVNRTRLDKKHKSIRDSQVNMLNS